MKPFAILLTLFAVGLTAALGQEPTPVPHAEHRAPARFDINFPGGTLAELVQALAKAGGEKVNIAFVNGAGGIEVPKMTLVGVCAWDVFSGLADMEGRSGSQDRWVCDGPQEMGGGWTVTKPFGSQTRVGVMFVGDLLKKYSIDDITAAITFALTTPGLNKMAPPKLRLHKETSLLIIQSDDQYVVQMAREVLGELKGSLH